MKVKPDNCLIIFIKYPEEGKVKTRLAQTLSNKFAFEFYKSCAEYTLIEASKLLKKKVDIHLFFFSLKSISEITNWIGGEFQLHEQRGENLGERMQHAFKTIFDKDYRKVIIIGTDLPDISENLIADFFSLLDKFDLVIGPSNDGGYYLLGMKKFYPQIFRNINWSTSEVLKSTLNILQKNEIKTKIIGELNDIDTESDLVTWINVNKEKNHPFMKILESRGLLKIFDERTTT